MTTFRQLNQGWNAEPNAPEPRLSVLNADLLLSFLMNPYLYPEFDEEDIGTLRFYGCSRYRLGSTNDEGWYRGQCRFSKIAPAWGEFYQVSGDLRLNKCPKEWIQLGPATNAHCHFLFYFHDETFECDALEWELEVSGRLVASGRG
ncbi:MAG: hypothetical protein KDB90_14545 [Planctomycetes bacterium]|nr:hypothetical protein [Planctomycetota bacterium]